jgi:CheY-like chemotaxis protein
MIDVYVCATFHRHHHHDPVKVGGSAMAPEQYFADYHSTGKGLHLSKKHVVCADGSPTFLRIMRLLLEGHGYRVTPAWPVIETFRKVAGEQPDLAIVDLIFAQDSSWTLLEMLRDDPHTGEIPLIVLSTDRTLLERARDNHGSLDYPCEYLQKPIDLDVLVEAVNRLSQRDSHGGP